jgi:hypothetical protein
LYIDVVHDRELTAIVDQSETAKRVKEIEEKFAALQRGDHHRP